MTGKVTEQGPFTEDQPTPYKNHHNRGLEVILFKDENGNIVAEKVLF
jgi:hypothetical protein